QRCRIANINFVQVVSGIRSVSSRRQMMRDVRALRRRIVKVVEVINDGYVPPAFSEQMIGEMRANEASAASNQNVSSHRANRKGKGEEVKGKGKCYRSETFLPFP